MSLHYISTRGDKTPVTASQAIIKGIAPDGGLYVPEYIPGFAIPFEKIAEMRYEELAYEVLKLYLTDFTEEELKNCIEKAYGTGFDCPEIALLAKADGKYYLELYHGRTIAFKDMALSIHPHLMTVSARKQNVDKTIAILVATSGDTGKAALAGFADVPGTEIIVFYPDGGVSEVQRLQMLTQEGKNVNVVGVKGNFDDTQNAIKDMFTDKEFAERAFEKGCIFSAANSISIGRLVPQVVYYFYSYAQMLKKGDIACGDEINFVVPTGNFGNILAGYYAKKMGLPIDKLICASNSNKVLYDFFGTGTYDRNREFILTTSPSMDILVSSNLERLLFDISDGNSEKVREAMENLSKGGIYKFSTESSCITAGYADETETFGAIKEAYEAGYLMDTHTAVAYAAYEKYLRQTGDGTKTVIVSTASPYKFGAAVLEAITGEDYSQSPPNELFEKLEEISGVAVPAAIDGIDKKPVLHHSICEKDGMKDMVIKLLRL